MVTLFIVTVEQCAGERSKGNAENCKVEQSCGSACQRSVMHGAAKAQARHSKGKAKWSAAKAMLS